MPITHSLSDPPIVNLRTLYRRVFHEAHGVEPAFVPQMQLSSERLFEEMIYHIERHVWAEDVGNIAISYPATWWDHFKARFFPRWALERWPVRWRSEERFITAYYPTFAPPENDKLGHARLEVAEIRHAH